MIDDKAESKVLKLFMSNIKTAEIYSIAFGGEGIARIDGKVCFVTGALPDEKTVIEVTEEKKNFTKGVLREIITPSQDRIENVCPLAFNCQKKGFFCTGCVYQHVSYEKEIEFKDRQFSELLKRFAGIPDGIKLPPVYSEKYLNYRNKITIHKATGNVNYFGFVSNDNITVLDVPECNLACDEINKALKELRLDIPGFLKNGKKILLRYSQKDGVLVLPENTCRNFPEYMTEDSEFGPFLVPPYSFFQTNIFSHDLLLYEFKKILNEIKRETVFDLYCGVGVFGILAAESGFKTYCADIDSEAVPAAKKNAEIRGLKNIEFLSGNAFDTSKKVFGKESPDKICLVIDPPRTGLDKTLIELLCEKKPKCLIYISCSPDTLCRDLKILMSAGYEIISTRIIDMFPRTKHFETITYLTV